MYDQLDYGSVIHRYVETVEHQIRERICAIEQTAAYNQWKVLRAFREHRVGDHHFAPSTGYGYDDHGRDTLERVYATVFGAEAAIVRPQLISGTHAIACCLFGVLRPGDQLLYITGKPYDTLDKVIGNPIKNSHEAGRTESGLEPVPGSLADFQIDFRALPLTETGRVDLPAVKRAITPKTKVIGIQRSRGYDNRPSLTVDEMERIIRELRRIREDLIVFVDNCYGEFVEKHEPTEIGADLTAGSLIKNPGGGLAKSGGYIVGRKDLIEQVGTRLFAPGIGLEGGPTVHSLLDVYQGFFMAPHVVGEALKGAVFSAAMLETLGFRTDPLWHEPRTDLIQAVEFGSGEHLIAFCQGIQQASPVNAQAMPQPGEMPGYEDPVIMAAGTFVQGASIELSADGPLRPPYLGFVQGGLTYEHVKIGLVTALNELYCRQLLKVPNVSSAQD
jgi:cystathionine beta-lyase family protein involved in aluminum resistance